MWIVVVLADFGRGKSLTARTLSYRFAERFLANTLEPSPDVPIPVFVRCQDHLRTSLGLKETARVAQRATLVDVLPLEKSDPAPSAIRLPAGQYRTIGREHDERPAHAQRARPIGLIA